MLLGLIEASGNKIGSPVANILTYCYHYDPQTNKHSLIVARVVQLGGMVTMAGLGGFMFLMFRRDLKLGREHDLTQSDSQRIKGNDAYQSSLVAISGEVAQRLRALFPREASTIAPYVDALYFFLLGNDRARPHPGGSAVLRLLHPLPPGEESGGDPGGGLDAA